MIRRPPLQGSPRDRARSAGRDRAPPRHGRVDAPRSASARSRRSRRCAGAWSSTSSSRPRRGRASPSRPPRSGSRPTRSTSPRKGTSVEKGESLLDTARNLQAMSPDLIVIRHGSPGVPHFLARHLKRRGRQRRRRRARAPDPGPARRAHDPPAPRAPRRAAGRDRRRHRALARRALEHLAADEDGREGHRLRPADAPAAADRGDRRRGARPTSTRRSTAPTSS